MVVTVMCPTNVSKHGQSLAATVELLGLDCSPALLQSAEGEARGFFPAVSISVGLNQLYRGAGAWRYSFSAPDPYRVDGCLMVVVAWPVSLQIYRAPLS